MPSSPDFELEREALRATLGDLDDVQRKIVAGVIALMIEHPQRVREREWIAEQFTQVALLACGFEDAASTREARARLQVYAGANIDVVLNASYRLFRVVAVDLAPRAAEGLSREDAITHALGYLMQRPD